jgi:ankyrin repeat protein
LFKQNTFYCSIKGYLKIIKILLEHNALIDKSLHNEITLLLVVVGYLKIIKILLEYGISIDKSTNNKKTPLLVLVHKDCKDVD